MPVQTEQPENASAERQERLKKYAAALKQLKIPEDFVQLPVDPNYHHPLVRHYRHKNTVLLNFHLLAGCVDQLARFQGRPSDIIVASFPKSGTTWLQELVWRIQHRETGVSSGDVPLEYRFPVLEMPSIKEMETLNIHDMPEPRFIKTHLTHELLPESVTTSGAKVLYVRRDPRDVCVSYYHFSRMVNYEQYRGTFQEYRNRFVRGEVMHGPYREHVKSYLDHADTVLCLTYEELHSDRAAAIRRIAAFLGRPLTDADVEGIVANTSFGAMKKNPSTNFKHWEENGFAKEQEGTFMRKGKVGDWSNYFTEEESDAFMTWRNQPI